LRPVSVGDVETEYSLAIARDRFRTETGLATPPRCSSLNSFQNYLKRLVKFENLSSCAPAPRSAFSLRLLRARRLHITGGQRRAAWQFARWRVSTDGPSACDRRDTDARVPQVDYCDYAGGWAVARTCHDVQVPQGVRRCVGRRRRGRLGRAHVCAESTQRPTSSSSSPSCSASRARTKRPVDLRCI
jgi:hypothetical protein